MFKNDSTVLSDKTTGRYILNVIGSISKGNHRKALFSLQISPNKQRPYYIQLTELNISQFILLHLFQESQNINCHLLLWNIGKMFDLLPF